MGTAPLTAANVVTNSTLTGTASYVGAGIASISTGQVGYLGGTQLGTSQQAAVSAVIDSATAFENVTGSAGLDVIIGSSAANTITGDAANDYINGGAGNDTITAGAGGDYLVGGAGDDTFVATTRAESLVAADGAVGGYDAISDFLSGTDKLDLAGALALTAAIDGVANLNARTQAFDTDMATTVAAARAGVGANSFADVGDVLVVNITGGNAAQTGVWVFQNITTAGFAVADDLAIKLVGTSSTPLVVGDFI